MFDFSIYMVTIKKYKIVLNYYSRTKYVQYIIKVGNLKVETDGPDAALQFIMYTVQYRFNLQRCTVHLLYT